MKKREYSFKSEVWLYPGMSGWHFVTVPKKDSQKITKDFTGLTKGWGSLPVNVTVGKTVWKTSIFPDKKTETFLLPVKSEVRKKEGIFDKDIIKLSIKII